MANSSNNLLAPAKFIKTLNPPPENCDSISANYSISSPSLFVGDTIVFTNLSQYYTNSKWYLNDTLISYDTHLSWIFVNGGAQEIRLEVEDSLLQCFALYSAPVIIISPIDMIPNLPIPVDDCPLFGCNHVAGFDFWMPGCQSYADFGNIANTPNACGALSCWRAAIGSPDYVVNSQVAASLTPGNSAGPLTNGQFCITSNPPVNPGALKFAFHNPHQNANLFGSVIPHDPAPGVTASANFYMEAPVTAVNIQSGQEYIVSYYRAFTKGLNNSNNANVLNNCGGAIANAYNNAALGSGLMFCNTPETNFGAAANVQFTNFQDALANPGNRLILEQPAVNDQEWRQVIEVINTNINYNRLVFYRFHDLPVLQQPGGLLWHRYGWMFLDQVEIVRSNCPTDEVFISCGESVTIGESCPITNMVYEWYMTDGNGNMVGLPFSNAQTITVSPTTTTTYGLIRRIAQLGEPGNNGYFVDNINAFNQTCFITVNVAPNTDIVPAFDINTTICQNVQYTLPTTSLNGISGTWVPAFSSANLGTTTYSFLPIGICPEPVSVTITVVPCGGCDTITWQQLSGVINLDLPQGNYRVVGNLVIGVNALTNGPVYFDDVVLAIDPTIEIVVPSDSKLIIEGSHLYNCHNRWIGIRVENLGRLDIIPHPVSNRTTLIEGSHIAVRIMPYSAANQTTFNNLMRIDNVTFNRNMCGIQINDYPYQNTETAFAINRCIFTSRQLWTNNPLVWPSTNFLRNSVNPGSGPNSFETPIMNNAVYPFVNVPTSSGIGWLSGYSPNSAPPIVGIDLYNVGFTQYFNTWTPPNFFSLGLNSASPDDFMLFDRVQRSLRAVNSNFDIYNSIFQSPTNISGLRAVESTNSIGTIRRVRVLGTENNPIRFYNFQRTIELIGTYEARVEHTDIRAFRPAINFSPNSPGANGIFVNIAGNLYRSLDISRNQFNNINTGIHIQGFGAAGDVNFEISENVFNEAYANGMNGLTSTSAISMETTNNPWLAGTINIRENIANQLHRGVFVAGFSFKGFFNIYENEINLAPMNISTFVPQNFGIWVRNVNCSPTTMYPYKVSRNSVVRQITSIANQESDFAIGLTNSANWRVACNQTFGTYTGLLFRGICPAEVSTNRIFFHRIGFFLDNATIGTQGSNTVPADNWWWSLGWYNTYSGGAGYTGPLPTSVNLKTYVRSSNTMASQMFVRNTPVAYNPNNSWGRFFIEAPYSTSFGPLVIASNPPSAIADCSNGLVLSDSLGIFATMMSENEFEILTASIDSVMLDSLGISSEVLKEHSTYRYLDVEEELRNEHESLENFYVSREPENVGKLRETEKLILEKEMALAESKVNEVEATNTIEDGNKLLYELQLKHYNNNFTSNDSLTLVALATACPFIEGDAVYNAQATFNQIYNTSQWFGTNCPPNLPKSLSYNSPEAEVQWDVTLYPNPNDNILYVQSNIADVKTGKCVIYSTDGKVIYSGTFISTKA